MSSSLGVTNVVFGFIHLVFYFFPMYFGRIIPSLGRKTSLNMSSCIGIHKQRLFISLEDDKNGHFKNGHVYLTCQQSLG